MTANDDIFGDDLGPMTVLDAVDLLAVEYKDPVFPVQHLVTDCGITLVTADTGGMKTAFLHHLSVSLALGKPVAGRFPVDPASRSVLYLNGEMPAAIIAQYLRQAASAFDDHLEPGCLLYEGPDGVADFRFDDAGCERLERLIGVHLPSIVIFDTQRALFEIDENDAGEVRRAFGFIRSLCTRFRTAAIVAHHLRKINAVSNSDRERVSGSRDIIAAVDIHIALRNRDGRPLHALALGKTRTPFDGVSAGTEWPITARLEGNPPRSIIIAGEPTSREAVAEKVADAESTILERLEAEGPMTVDALGAASGNMKRAHESLRKAGKVGQVGKDGRKVLYGIIGLHDEEPTNLVNLDQTRDQVGEKPNKHKGTNLVNPDQTRDRAGRFADEIVSPPSLDGDHLSSSSTNLVIGQHTIGTKLVDQTRDDRTAVIQ